MKQYLLWRKTARVIRLLARRLKVSDLQAMNIFYNSKVSEWLQKPDYGMQIMSDAYIVDEICLQLLRGK